MNDTIETAKLRIIDLLQSSSPCQFRSIVLEVLTQVPNVGSATTKGAAGTIGLQQEGKREYRA